MGIERISWVVSLVNKATFIEYISLLYIEKFIKIEVLNDIIRFIDINSHEIWMIIKSYEIDMSDLIWLMILEELND